MPWKAQFGSHAQDHSGRRTVRWQLLGELALLLCIAAALRLFVFYRTPLIARDGMLYVGIARTINHGMWLDLVGDWFLFNPYPALIAWLNRCGLDFELAGQWISVVASALAVVPLYLWCRRAYDVRVAQLAGLTYALHPVLLRFSAQVLREGLYWCLMLWAVYFFWQAATQRKWWWFVLAGLATTASALTRMEGAVVFALGALWTFWLLPPTHAADAASTRRTGWLPSFDGLSRVGLSFAMLPLTLIVLNLLFVPTGRGWHGFGRWAHFAVRATTGQEISPVANKVPDRMVYIVADERARAAKHAPPIDDIRKLAKSLPAWNPLGEPDPKVLRLQRLLILADDQQQFLIIGRFLNECWDGLLFPCLLCCAFGLYACRTTIWMPRRDWPLVGLAVALSALLIYHLATEYILEPRYMFCLIPFVFPWSAIGARELYLRAAAWCALRPAWSTWLPRPQVLCALLMLWAVGKLSLGIEDHHKAFQRELGDMLRKTATKRLKIAGPESLKRVAHYADADYFIIPRGNTEEARQWLDTQPLDLVLLTAEDMPAPVPVDALLPEKSIRYQHWTADAARTKKVQVYTVNHKLKQVAN